MKKNGASPRSEHLPSLTRRRALGLLGASALGALGASAVHPLVPVAEGEEWKPRFLDDEQLSLVAELAELILPETDTPGARAALVHQYIDWVVSENEAEARATFTAGLAWIEAQSRSRFGKRFLELEASQRTDILGHLARAAENGDEAATGVSESAITFFEDLKRHTIHGYYRSEVGMYEELGYGGNDYLDRFPGCRHPEHHSWRPGAKRGDGKS